MKLKTIDVNGTTYAEVIDGKPVFIHDDGKEVPFDVLASISKISALNGEAKTHREAKEAAETKLRAFEGIEDAEAAKKALETIKNINDNELIAAGKVEEMKAGVVRAAEEKAAAAAKAANEKIASLDSQVATLTRTLDDTLISNAFANSAFIKDKVAAPVDMIQAVFGARFKRKDGKLIAYDAAGGEMYSRSNAGELAEFDEALERLVDLYPHRDSILKGSGANGAGSQAFNQGGGGGGGKNPFAKETQNLTEAQALIKSNPERARALAQQAGFPVNW